MPEAAISAPAPATAAPVAPSSPQSPTPPPSGPPIHVTEAAVVDKGPAQPPPKPGSAKERMFADLRKKAGEEPEVKPAVTPKPAPQPKPEEGQVSPEAPESGEAPPAAPADKKQDKVSPWKLVSEHKAARLKAETELAELRKTIGDPSRIKEIEEKAANFEKRAKELEDHIKFVDFSKSREFQEKYQKPYEDAWTRWMGELGELTVQDQSTGQERPMEASDLLKFVQMDLKEAREAAESVFGSFADDVMSARKEIKALWKAQNTALEQAKKDATAMTEQQQKQAREAAEATGNEIRKLWAESNQRAISDEKYGKYFKPVEGDEEGNKRLAQGYEMADKAFSASPLDPRLTAEERASIVRLHSAVRNRSAAFGRVTYLNQQLEAKVAELTAELAKYQNAEPGTDQQKPTESQAGHTSARDEVFGALRKIAH